jgi:hypothetical protein
MIVTLKALANPLRNALSSFHPPDTGIAADFQVVASTAIRLAQNKSFPDIPAALIVVCPLWRAHTKSCCSVMFKYSDPLNFANKKGDPKAAQEEW